MSPEEKIRDLITRFMGELDQGGETALRALSKYQSEDIKFHMATKEIRGIDNYFPLFNVYQSAFKNMKHEIQEVSVCKDLATIRLIFRGDSVDTFMGLPPTHKRVTMPIVETMRIKGDKIVEVWNYYDGLLGLVQQLEGEIRPKIMHVMH